MASKHVTDREKSADSVIAVETHADAIAEALAPTLKRHLKKGQTLPDVALLVRLLCAELETTKTRLVAADEAHQTELDDDPPVRKERDDTAASLYDTLVQLREMITGAHGPAISSAVFNGSTPEDPVVLARFAGEVATRLEKTTFPPSRIKGAKLDPAALAEDLREKRAHLDRTFKSVQREVREAQATLAAKDRALAAHDTCFSSVATTLTGLLHHAGNTDLAAKVRPSTRRPGQTATEAGETPDPTPATPSPGTDQ